MLWSYFVITYVQYIQEALSTSITKEAIITVPIATRHLKSVYTYIVSDLSECN